MPSVVTSVLCLLTIAATTSAQLTDLQPGRNFPTAVNAFGANHSENVDLADVDNDGDRDVGVANGGDAGPRQNRLVINQGGLQAGVEGTFVDETDIRLPTTPTDTSRDLEFVDWDDDGDLDLFVANRGTSLGGEVSRAHLNQGGLQAGPVGTFVEVSDDFWGTLESVHPSAEVGAVDGMGPWGGYSCDCDFADLDDDGDLDLFQSDYGVNINGNGDSRVFLNDSAGVFHELWPWADPAADIRLHTLDVDLADLDGDFDLDIAASSRDSHARIYRNNRYGGTGSGEPFTDVTQAALIDTGAGSNGTNNYETEYFDADGDGDFDLWMVNYDGFGGGNLDRILRNDGGLAFSLQEGWIKGDPNADENEVDLFDYDGDGDLDALSTNWGGTSWIYQSGLAQGLGDLEGLYHRTGTGSGGSLAPAPETPTSGNQAVSLDGQTGDLDGDGDPDVVIARTSGDDNRVWFNALGIPDTHAPEIVAFTVAGTNTEGEDTVIHARVVDNSSYAVVAGYVANLFYRENGGLETCVRMLHQGGQQFRGVIPGGFTGLIDYRIEITDDAGNTGISSPSKYFQLGDGHDPWQTEACGTPGLYGVPVLEGGGPLTAGSQNLLDLRRAAPSALAFLFLAAGSNPTPFKGGTLVTVPVVFTIPLVTDGGGQIPLAFPMPPGVPGGSAIWWQYGIADPTASGGASLSNAVVSTAP